MLKLKADPTFKATVTIPIPGDKAGMPITLEYKHMTKEAYDSYIKSEKKKKRTDAEALADFVVGWDEVDGEFTQENLQLLCQIYHGAASAIAQGWITELTNYRSGN